MIINNVRTLNPFIGAVLFAAVCGTLVFSARSAMAQGAVLSGPNVASGANSVVAGGAGNTAGGDFSTIAGGFTNSATGTNTTVSGGSFNNASGFVSTVGGGQGNRALGETATVGGGSQNTASNACATVSGGEDNTAGGNRATVGGGQNNQALSFAATVSGGQQNTANGTNATVSGGANNQSTNSATVGGGQLNVANGVLATIPGGSNNLANARAFAAGVRAKARHDGAFVWSGVTNVDTFSTNSRSFTVRAPGGVRFITSTTATNFTQANPILGVILRPGSTAWTALSDRASKTDFQQINPREVLSKLAAMPVTSWKYKHDPSRRYIGPTSQDFMEAFHLGDNDKGINTLDADGVTFAAIQGLVEELKERDRLLEDLKVKSAKVESLESKNEELTRQIEAIQKRLDSLPPAH
jgi:hypothetical protein